MFKLFAIHRLDATKAVLSPLALDPKKLAIYTSPPSHLTLCVNCIPNSNLSSYFLLFLLLSILLVRDQESSPLSRSKRICAPRLAVLIA